MMKENYELKVVDVVEGEQPDVVVNLTPFGMVVINLPNKQIVKLMLTDSLLISIN